MKSSLENIAKTLSSELKIKFNISGQSLFIVQALFGFCVRQIGKGGKLAEKYSLADVCYDLDI